MSVATVQSPPSTVTTLMLKPREDFVQTPQVAQLADRAISYLQCGLPIHFRGAAGTGKTTLALHVAAQLGRPVMLIMGDDEFSTSDLVGSQSGYRYRKVVDRFIHSVLKYEENSTQYWVDNRLTTACREGYTLVYDEFTRSHAEANNVLLSVLEERLLVLPAMNRSETYLRVHPDFRAIFTSNPQDYSGVHGAQDALMDRLVTLELEFYDALTEAEIVASRAGISVEIAEPIVALVRNYRDGGQFDQTPTMRAAISIGRMVAMQEMVPTAENEAFVLLCLDMLASKKQFAATDVNGRSEHLAYLRRLIANHF